MLSDVVQENYDKTPSYRRLQELDWEIRDLQSSDPFRVLLQEISRGRRLQSDPELAQALRVFGIGVELEGLIESYERTIRKYSLNPPIKEQFYAEWDEKQSAIDLILPFANRNELTGLTLWYSRINHPFISRKNDLLIRYEKFQIDGIESLHRAHEALRRLVNPKEFEMLNIELHPTVIGTYSSKTSPILQIEEPLPLEMHPSKRSRFKLIGECVLEYWDTNEKGVPPRTIRQMLDGKNQRIHPTKIQSYMAEMSQLGYLQRNDARGGLSVMYYPVGVMIRPH